MLIALNYEGERTPVKDAEEGQCYFCPICKEQLVLRKGKVRARHFAHLAHTQCTDGWHYDMSDWHAHWQARFPIECQEVVKTVGEKKHRADVLIEDCQTVIEFQHSRLGPEEFEDRNSFYNGLGYKVIWVFDVVEAFWKNSLWNEFSNHWEWSWPKSSFSMFKPYAGEVAILLQLINDPEDDETIQEVIAAKKKDGPEAAIDSASVDYYEKRKDGKITLIKVASLDEKGMKAFKTDGKQYTVQDVRDGYSRITTLRYDALLGELCDYLPVSSTTSHTAFYSGCPRSPSGFAATWDLDVPRSMLPKICICSNCEFLGEQERKCKKRVIDAQIPVDAKILGYEREGGFLRSIRYLLNGTEQTVQLPEPVLPKDELEESLFELWEKHNPSVAIFRNVETNLFVKIHQDPAEMKAKYGKVYGTISPDQYDFRERESLPVYFPYKKVWVLVWKKEKGDRS